MRPNVVSIRLAVESLEPRRLMNAGFDATFNFQPEGSPLAPGTIADYGNIFGDRGNGYLYGWTTDSRGIMRDRNKTADQRLDTVAQMQQGGDRTWEVQVPNGQYEVTLTSGDSRYLDGEHHIDAEGTRVMYGVQSSKKRFLKSTKLISVNDGRLTISPESSGVNSKLNSVRVVTHHPSGIVVDGTPQITVRVLGDPMYERGTDTTAHLWFERSEFSDDSELVVKLDWSGSASTKDFVGRPNFVTIPKKSTYADLTLRGRADDLNEGDEIAKVKVVPLVGYTVGSPATASVILHDGTDIVPPPPPPKPSVNVYSEAGNNTTIEGAASVLIHVGVNSLGDEPLTLNFNWSGTAGASEYEVGRYVNGNFVTYASPPSSMVVSADGSFGTEFYIRPLDDSVAEPTETVILSIAPSDDYVISSGSGSATVKITDNDEPPSSFANINWSTTSSPPTVLCETTSIVIDNQLYLFGGFTANFKPQKVAYRFNGSTWTQLRDTPVAFTQPGCTLVDGKLWIAGGYIGKDTGGQNFGTTDVRLYDPATDSWSMGPSLPSARSTGNLLKVGRKLYFVGGETANRAADTNSMFVYDLDNPTAGWTNGPSMPLARNRAAAVVVDSKIYIVGGQTGFDGGLTAHNEIQIFDTATNSWTVAAKKLPDVRTHVMNSVQYYNGRIILVTGENAHDKPQNNVWSIDPSTLVTTALNPFPDSRFTTATGIVNGKLYAIGGYRGGIATQGYVGTFV